MDGELLCIEHTMCFRLEDKIRMMEFSCAANNYIGGRLAPGATVLTAQQLNDIILPTRTIEEIFEKFLI